MKTTVSTIGLGIAARLYAEKAAKGQGPSLADTVYATSLLTFLLLVADDSRAQKTLERARAYAWNAYWANRTVAA